MLSQKNVIFNLGFLATWAVIVAICGTPGGPPEPHHPRPPSFLIIEEITEEDDALAPDTEDA